MRDELHKKGHKFPFSFLHVQTLRYIKEKKQPFMRDVAKYLLITPPATTLLVDGLVKDGLLARIVDKHDRRAVRIRATKKGEALLARGARNAAQTFAKIFSPLSAKERDQFAALLAKVMRR